MARGARLSEGERQELWRRWKEGQTLYEIGAALSKQAAAVQQIVAARGGFAPPVRRRSRLALSLAEREEISRGLATGRSLRAISARIARPACTVCREVSRNGGRGYYRASEADELAWQLSLRPKLCRLALRPLLRRLVARKLALQWSPAQISGWLERAYAHNQAMRVSHETIYRSLFIQARGVLKRELIAQLRSRRLMRRVKGAGEKRGRIPEAVSEARQSG